MKASQPAPPWFRRLGNREHPQVRVFCFHHAGGGASVYRSWPMRMPSPIEPVAVQLPGRENRIQEVPFDRMEDLVGAVVEALAPVMDLPFAFYGHSMGARVAWAVTRQLLEDGLPLPRILYVASSSAPSLEIPVRGWSESTEGLLAYVKEMGGTPDEILADPEYLEDLLPVLRADLTVVGTHRYLPAEPLPVPIRAFVGREDHHASAQQLQGWATETDRDFSLEVCDGGHFFSAAGHQHVINDVVDGLMPRDRSDAYGGSLRRSGS